MPRITIADVAREAGVSTMTVSRVINNKQEISAATRERVQRIIDRLGYRPNSVARSLTTRQTLTLGLMIPDITNPFFPEIVRGAEDTAGEHGYALMLCSTIENQERERFMLRLLEDKRVDGTIVCSARLPDDELFPLLEQQRAVVLINRPAMRDVAASVRVDDAYGSMRAVHHLLAGGRKLIGFLGGPANAYSAKQRFQGYATVLETTGRVVDPDLSVPCTPNEEGGYAATKALLAARREVDGLVCYNDLAAIGALQACGELGIRIPDDLAVVGCDDIRLASLVTPALTTLRISKYGLGAAAARLLIERIQGKKGVDEVVIKPELVVRASAPSASSTIGQPASAL